MNTLSKYKSRLLTITLTTVALAVTLGLVNRRHATPVAPQEITLIAKDVAFFLPDRPEANPAIDLTRGRPVKLTIRNDEPGKVLHCITIGGMNAKTTQDLATGESEVLSFTPGESGTFTYACLMHQGMAGKVIVK